MIESSQKAIATQARRIASGKKGIAKAVKRFVKRLCPEESVAGRRSICQTLDRYAWEKLRGIKPDQLEEV